MSGIHKVWQTGMIKGRFHTRNQATLSDDFLVADFATIGDVVQTWYDLDISAIIPPDAYAVYCRLTIMDTASICSIVFSNPVLRSLYNCVLMGTQVINVYFTGEFIIGVSDQKVSFYTNVLKPSDFSAISLNVLGWWE